MFGGAIATVDGIRRVLLSVGAAPDAPPVNGRQVCGAGMLGVGLQLEQHMLPSEQLLSAAAKVHPWTVASRRCKLTCYPHLCWPAVSIGACRYRPCGICSARSL